MHQSWPKFVQNLFYATPDRGVAALQYGPATVQLLVGDSTRLTLTETTGFPFREAITFTLALDKSDEFPVHLRIPGWADGATVSVNGQDIAGAAAGAMFVEKRSWNDGDVIELRLPMKIKVSVWHDFSKAVERGPLVYALGVKSKVSTASTGDSYGSYTEHRPAEPWNFGLLNKALSDSTTFRFTERNWDGRYPWNLQAAPVSITLPAVRIPEWTATNGLPHFPAFWGRYAEYQEEDLQTIELVPYGCTTLRISTFPAYNLAR